MSVRSSKRAPTVGGSVTDGNLAIFQGTDGTIVDGGPPAGGGGTVTNTGTLTANQLVIGNGGVDVKALGAAGTTTTVLHGNAAGAPSYGAVSLTADVSGDLPFANLVQASAESKLVGRGQGSGGGDYQEVSIGSGLAMTGTTLSATGTGGNVTSTGAVGSEPGSPASGDLYLPNNGFSIERYSGAAWVPWGPLFPHTAPVNGDFSWVNQGSAAVSTTNGGITLTIPVSAGVNLRERVKSAPSTPYTITAIFLCQPISLATQNYGLLFRQSSDGKVQTFGISAGTNTANIGTFKYTSATVFSATYSSRGIYSLGALTHLRIADDGVNRICSISANGQTWVDFHSVGRTDFLTADQVGFFADDNTNTYTMAVTLLSWIQA